VIGSDDAGAKEPEIIMIARYAALMAIGLAVALVAHAARAADPSAQSFVQAIYDQYKGKDSKGVDLTGDAAVRRYFSPTLAALIFKDRREARGEVGKLDADPFIDAQDWELEDLEVAVSDTAAGKAIATVSFKNLGQRQTVILDLVKLRQDWRIADIIWDRKATLRGLLTGK
jgi:Protein of unknown function (DUF3828)